MEISRQKFLKQLDVALLGVSQKEEVSQSTSFVFEGGFLVTFDGEFCTKQSCDLGFEGAVFAADLHSLLKRFTEDTIDISVVGNEIRIKGKHKRAGLKLMQEILLPYKEVPSPKGWEPCAEGLKQAMLQASRICGKNESAPKTTHVHMAGDRVEATDSFRIVRHSFTTGILTPILIHKDYVAKLCRMDLKEVCWTRGWLHVRCSEGEELSCVRSAMDYYPKEKMDEFLKIKGQKIELPSTLEGMLHRAEVMDTPASSIGGWEAQVHISLAKGRLEVMSRKDEGWFQEIEKVAYKGPDLAFTIDPSFFKDILTHTNVIQVSDTQIGVMVGCMNFVTSLEKRRD